MTEFTEIWSYLARDPLLWLAATLVAYAAAERGARALGGPAWANPVLGAVLMLAALLWATGTPYAAYFEGAQFVHFLLGPVTVALAVPLVESAPRIRRALWPMAAALLAGTATAMGSAVALARALGLERELTLALLPKSATAPVAIGVAEAVGGAPTLTAVLVIATGIAGAVMAEPLLDLLRVRDARARGFAVGVAAHGIGTARAFRMGETAGAFAGIGMALAAVGTALLAPAAAAWLVP